MRRLNPFSRVSGDRVVGKTGRLDRITEGRVESLRGSGRSAVGQKVEKRLWDWRLGKRRSSMSSLSSTQSGL